MVSRCFATSDVIVSSPGPCKDSCKHYPATAEPRARTLFYSCQENFKFTASFSVHRVPSLFNSFYPGCFGDVVGDLTIRMVGTFRRFEWTVFFTKTSNLCVKKTSMNNVKHLSSTLVKLGEKIPLICRVHFDRIFPEYFRYAPGPIVVQQLFPESTKWPS